MVSPSRFYLAFSRIPTNTVNNLDIGMMNGDANAGNRTVREYPGIHLSLSRSARLLSDLPAHL